MGAYAAQQAEHALDKERRRGQFSVDKMGQVVQVRNVVALEFEAGAVGAAGREDVFDVGKGVLEDQIAAFFEVIDFLLVLEFLEARQHRIQAEVH